MKRNEIISPQRLVGEEKYELSLRPNTFSEFIGKEELKRNLKIFIEAAKIRNENLDHILLFGPQGLGKTTLGYIIANELGTSIKVTSGPVLEKPIDLVGILTGLKEKQVLFIDEIHRISRVVEEYLYTAMENFSIDIMLDKGPAARCERIDIPHFTLIGATTRFGMLTSSFRARFGIVMHLDYYLPEELQKIVERSARLLGIEVNEDASSEIAKCSRGTPRIANRLLRRVRDFAQVVGKGYIDKEIVAYALENLGVDKYGLDRMDRIILRTIAEKFSGGPVGLKSLAAAITEEPETIEEVYEPYLIKMGFMKRTAKGRVVTPKGFECAGIKHLQKKLI